MSTIRNERTSARVAKIAGKLLSMKLQPWTNADDKRSYVDLSAGMWRDIRALAASALTQAAEHLAVVGQATEERAMTKDESTAMDWLGIHAAKGNTHAKTLQAMLAELAERRGAFGAWPGQVTLGESTSTPKENATPPWSSFLELAIKRANERPKRKGR